MTWTYDVTTIGTSKLTQIRRLVGDVIDSDQQVQDEEITFALSLRSSIYGAAADVCRMIAAQYSRKTNVVTSGGGGNLTQNYSQQAMAYASRAAQYENIAISAGGALPIAGGISITDKNNTVLDTDRVAPQFKIGMDDNFLPVAPQDASPGDPGLTPNE